jgi:hypothetical protein
MLNLRREERPLMQGQSPARMVVARSVQIDEISSTTGSQRIDEGPRQSAEGSTGGAVDAYAVARLVFDLLRADLRVEHERRSAGR